MTMLIIFVAISVLYYNFDDINTGLNSISGAQSSGGCKIKCVAIIDVLDEYTCDHKINNKNYAIRIELQKDGKKLITYVEKEQNTKTPKSTYHYFLGIYGHMPNSRSDKKLESKSPSISPEAEKFLAWMVQKVQQDYYDTLVLPSPSSACVDQFIRQNVCDEAMKESYDSLHDQALKKIRIYGVAARFPTYCEGNINHRREDNSYIDSSWG